MERKLDYQERKIGHAQTGHPSQLEEHHLGQDDRAVWETAAWEKHDCWVGEGAAREKQDQQRRGSHVWRAAEECRPAGHGQV